jgi:hypothetical protein
VHYIIMGVLLPPTALQLSVPTTRNRRVIRLQYTRLTLIGLRKGISALFAHALHLPDLPDGFLELLHPI